MTYKGIIFDLNGTMLLDSHLHEIAWFEIAKALREKPLTIEEFQINGHGRTNAAIIAYLCGTPPDQVTIDDIIERKEGLYREMCLQSKANFKLADGVAEFLNQVKELNIARTIATGSYIKNVNFYFDHLNLGSWFNMKDIVFDDGLFPGKPEPFPYLRAAEQLGLHPKECVVFEDSYSGITSAIKAEIGRIITVEPELDASKVKAIGKVYKMVNGFNGLLLQEIIN
ncbi:MAG: HAD family phosphatase [Salinivirgaceae bacterium]|nr:HAD family phosphatase [Salinivirgaceae bacterium]